VDVGLNLKATPSIHRDGSIGLQLELQLSALGPVSANGDPVILNSEFNGFVSANDGEPIVAAGNLMESTSATRSGWAGVSAIPGLGSIFSSPTKQVSDDELLIVITPHVIVPSGGTRKPDSFVYRSAR
jgi:type II secretory pathway component GspD/PulD (secretin)